MAETPADQSPARTQAEARSGSGHQSSQYWCYSCDKRVAIETLADLPDVVCFECKNGFVEAISLPSAAAAALDPLDDPNFGSQFVQVLRLIAQAAREDDAPPPLPSDPSSDDYLQIELDEWDNDDAEEEDGEEEEDEDEHSIEVVREEEAEENREREAENNRSDEDDEGGEATEEDEIPRGPRMRRYEFLRRHLTEFASRATSRRNRILDWADVLMGLENHSVELTLQDTYVGNPGDYVDASEYEALLQNLAESDSARRGAPPAAKAAMEALESVEIHKEDDTVVCAICKDLVNVGEIAKNLPCGHLYHSECIVPWLGARNTCPVCRFELPTDDPEYEEERKKRALATGLRVASTGSSASAGDDHAALE